MEMETSIKRDSKESGLDNQKFRLKREIAIGEILTVIAIVISAVTLLTTLAKDRRQRVSEQANNVRSTSAKALAKLERWQDHSLRYYQNIEPIFVDASVLFAKDRDMAATRDFLWKRLGEEKSVIEQKKSQEEIETAFVELYSYDSKVFDIFVTSIKRLKKNDEDAFDQLRVQAERDVLAEKVTLQPGVRYQTANLGNALRKSCNEHRKSLQVKFDSTLEQIRKILLGVIAQSDEQISQKKYASP